MGQLCPLAHSDTNHRADKFIFKPFLSYRSRRGGFGEQDPDKRQLDPNLSSPSPTDTATSKMNTWGGRSGIFKKGIKTPYISVRFPLHNGSPLTCPSNFVGTSSRRERGQGGFKTRELYLAHIVATGSHPSVSLLHSFPFVPCFTLALHHFTPPLSDLLWQVLAALPPCTAVFPKWLPIGTLHSVGSHFATAEVSSAVTEHCIEQPNPV